MDKLSLLYLKKEGCILIFRPKDFEIETSESLFPETVFQTSLHKNRFKSATSKIPEKSCKQEKTEDIER